MLSPSVSADTGATLSQLLDELDPPACEVFVDKASRRRCGKAAAWLLSSSCGHSFYYCTECRALLLLAIARDEGRAECDQHPAAPVRIRLDWVKL